MRQVGYLHGLPDPSAFEIEVAIEKLKNHKSPGIDQIPAELIKVGGRTIRCEIHKFIISIWNKEELPDEWKGSITVTIQGVTGGTDQTSGECSLGHTIPI